MSSTEQNQTDSSATQATGGGSDPSAVAKPGEGTGAAGAPSPESTASSTPTATPAADDSKVDPAKEESKTDEPAKGNEGGNGEQKEEPKASGDSLENYELRAPEGIEPDHVKAVEAYAKEQGLSNEQAQSILDRDAALRKAQVDSLRTLAETVWPEQVKNDVELAGKDGKELARNLELAKHAADRWMTPELKKTLDSTGLGNHPGLIKTWARIGRAMADDTFVGGASGGGGNEPPVFDQMYPSMKGK